MDDPIGTRLIDSTPPATTTSYWPLVRPAAAKCTDCCDEPHCRSTVTPGTLSGQPAASTALRAMSNVCSPNWLTQPQITSSTTAGSMPVRPVSVRSTCADRSTGCTPASAPFRLPTGVRTAATITASRTAPPPFGVVLAIYLPTTLNGVCRARVRARRTAFRQLSLAAYGGIMRGKEVVASNLAGDPAGLARAYAADRPAPRCR